MIFLKIAKPQTQKKDMNIMISQERMHVAICRAMSKKSDGALFLSRLLNYDQYSRVI